MTTPIKWPEGAQFIHKDTGTFYRINFDPTKIEFMAGNTEWVEVMWVAIDKLIPRPESDGLDAKAKEWLALNNKDKEIVERTDALGDIAESQWIVWNSDSLFFSFHTKNFGGSLNPAWNGNRWTVRDRVDEKQAFLDLQKISGPLGSRYFWTGLFREPNIDEEIWHDGGVSLVVNLGPSKHWIIGIRPEVDLSKVPEVWAIGAWTDGLKGSHFRIDDDVYILEGYSVYKSSSYKSICYGFRYEAHKLPDQCPEGKAYTGEYRDLKEGEQGTQAGYLTGQSKALPQPCFILRDKENQTVDSLIEEYPNGIICHGSNGDSIIYCLQRSDFLGFFDKNGNAVSFGIEYPPAHYIGMFARFEKS